MVALNPQIGKEIMVLLSSDKLMYGMICLNKHLSSAVKMEVISKALKMHTNPTGKQILTLFQIDIITSFNPSLLDTTVTLLNKRNHLDGSLLVKKRIE